MKKIIFILILGLVVICSIYSNSKSYFEYAKENVNKYKPKRKDYVIVVDYTKSILSERLYVIDMVKNEIIISSRVSHAWNSGIFTPNECSNIIGSNKTCVGTFITRGTTFGKFGYSMIVDGLDKGKNNNAKSRAIIVHSTKKMKTIWSNGCFATSEDVNKKIIDLTKNGCLICVIN
jgi:hypothetical protein